MKTLLQRLGFRGAVQSEAASSSHTEVELAGWVPSPPELRPSSDPQQPAPAGNAEPDALVARFYAAQEC